MRLTKHKFSTSVAASHYGVCERTIRNWTSSGTLEFTLTKGGHRRIDVSQPNPTGGRNDKSIPTKSIALYSRVSSRKQLGNRKNQEDSLKRAAVERFGPDASILAFNDVGSGLNFKRKGLQALLESVMQRRISTVVVAYRDRLARFGFELIEWILGRYNTKIMVLNSEDTDPHERVTEDILAILTVFSARAHGMRAYKKTFEKELGESLDDGCNKRKGKRNTKT
jgi:putative resolvase